MRIKAFRYEIRRDVRNIAVYFLFFLLASICLLQIGISRLGVAYQEETDLKALEMKLTDRYINYYQYGVYGIRSKIHPEEIAAMFNNSSPFLNTIAFFDVGVRIYFSDTVSTDNALDSNGYIDFSWLLMIVGSFLV